VKTKVVGSAGWGKAVPRTVPADPNVGQLRNHRLKTFRGEHALPSSSDHAVLDMPARPHRARRPVIMAVFSIARRRDDGPPLPELRRAKRTSRADQPADLMIEIYAPF